MSGTHPTEFQNQDEQARARRLSLQRTKPPGTAAGYEIQRFLGAGAYGEVWVGTDRNTGRRVAIKFYLHRGGLDWRLLSHEVEKLVFLSADRYVVQLLDVGWNAEPPFYVMEYVENGSLDELLRDRRCLPPDQAVPLFRDLAVGLSHAHGKGVLHCDLKPANILLDQDLRPRLADFGQSRLSHDQTPALGTLFYMAPEQADLQAVPDARWDVYALGAILYCMLTGEPPYREPPRVARIDAAGGLAQRLEVYRREIATAPRPQQHRRLPGVDGALADIVDQCLAIEPDARYPNVQAVLDALEARHQARLRRPLLLVGLVGPALLLLIMIVVYWQAFGRAVAQAERMVVDQTYRSNQFAAKFLAKSFEAELSDYFAYAERAAQQPDLRDAMRAASDTPLLARLNDPQVTGDELLRVQNQFIADPARDTLTAYLEAQLERLNETAGADGAGFDSVFVVDRWGTMLADAYVQDVATRSVGRNFSWRSYFHGGPEDLPRERPRELPPVIETSHLSAVFKSATTDKWKIAITTPIFDGAADPTVLGVLSLTINVGDFGVFRNRAAGTDYFAVLVDNRRGERRGTILQHPLFQQQPPVHDYCLSEPQLEGVREKAGYRYRDPLAEAPGGAKYAGEWIAASAPVELPGRGKPPLGNGKMDLLVLVQVNAASATAPVRQLGRRLTFDGVVALTLVMFAVLALWVIVFRLPGRPTPTRPGGPASPETSELRGTSTLTVGKA